MNSKANTVLRQMVAQYHDRHKRLPEKIVLAPLACLALSIKAAKGREYLNLADLPVTCREIQEQEATKDRSQARSLGVFVLPEDRTARLVSCDLRT